MGEQRRACRAGFHGLRLLGVVMLMGVSSVAAAQDGAGAGTPLERYRACPVVGLSLDHGLWIDSDLWAAPPPVPDPALSEPDSWVTAPSALSRHQVLRERLGEKALAGGFQIRIFREYGHGTSNESSLIATRLEDGRWVADEVEDVLIGDPENRSSYARWTLGPRNGQVLDALLADPCLRAEPSRSAFSRIAWSGHDEWTLEVIDEGSPLSFKRSKGGFGRVTGILHILNRGRP